MKRCGEGQGQQSARIYMLLLEAERRDREAATARSGTYRRAATMLVATFLGLID